MGVNPYKINMKHFFIICLLSCMLFSCTKGEESGNNNNETPVKPKDKITLELTKIDADAYCEPITIEFNATSAWNIEVFSEGSDDWIIVEPENGKAGNAKVSVTIAPNNWYPAREGSIVIYAGNAQKTVDIKQDNITAMLPLLESTYVSSDYSKDGKIYTMQQATEGNGIDIVFMGDGFADSRINDGSYHKTMMYAMEMIFAHEPYKSFRHLFNCYYVNVISKYENFDNQETALQTYFGEGTSMGGHTGIIQQLAYNVVGEDKMDDTLIVVIANNSSRHGTCLWYNPEKQNDYGSGCAIAWNALEEIWLTIPHECGGHGFGKLYDEYVTYDETIPYNLQPLVNSAKYKSWGWNKNIDFTNDPNTVKWSHFLTDSRYKLEVGIYEGACYYRYGAYRPSYESMMSNNVVAPYFNAPSREAIYYRIHKLAYGEEWEYDYEKFVEYDAINRGSTQTRSQPTDYVTKQERHAAPIIVSKTWREAMTE